MKHYEMLCVLPGTMTEDEVSAHMKLVTETVKELGAEITNVYDKGKTRLAYPMKHIRYGYFQLMYFKAAPEALAPIEKKLQLLGNLLRIMTRTIDASLESKLAGMTITPQQRQSAEETAPVAQKTKKSDAPKKAAEKKGDVTLEQIDEKLDEILDKDLAKV